MNDPPANVSPERVASVSPQAIPVLGILKRSNRSPRPSLLTSLTLWRIAPAPSGPNCTVGISTCEVGSNGDSGLMSDKMATQMPPLDRGLITLRLLPGLMSILIMVSAVNFKLSRK